MMTPFRSILITGSSSGIGASLALEFAAPNVALSLVGRSTDRLQEIADKASTMGADVLSCACDVTDARAIADFINQADAHQALDLVVANAGISSGSAIATGDIDTAKAVFDVNVQGVIQTILPVAERMSERGTGHTSIVSSIAGFRGLPTAPAYSASKVAVNAWGNAVRPLLAEKGVGLSMIYPGFVESRITDKNDFPMPFKMPAKQAAQIIRQGLEKRKRSIAFPWQMALATRLISSLPGPLFDQIMARAPKKN